MAFHDDLLQQALELAHKEPLKPRQASLRRAVSTAYYALFHLLVHHAVANWRRSGQRAELARAFDHYSMKVASNRVQGSVPRPGHPPSAAASLREVAKTFVEAQQSRHTADYDNATFWTRTEALDVVRSVQHAFALWQEIADEPIAQDYLLALLVKKRD